MAGGPEGSSPSCVPCGGTWAVTDQPPGLRLWDKGSSLRAPQALPGQRWSGLHGRTWGRPGPQLGGVGDMGRLGHTPGLARRHPLH